MKIHLKRYEVSYSHVIGDEIRECDTVIKSWCGLKRIKDNDDYEFITNNYRKVTCEKCLAYGGIRIKLMKKDEEKSMSRFEL